MKTDNQDPFTLRPLRPLSPLRILQVNAYDEGGGAEQVVQNLHTQYQTLGYPAQLAVGEQRTQNTSAIAIPKKIQDNWWSRLCLGIKNQLLPLDTRVRGVARLRKALGDLAIGWDVVPRWRGMEEFHFPGTPELLKLNDFAPTLIHAHNLHGNYFDLRALKALSVSVPIVLTLHDAWLLSGNCAHSFGCERWKTGCGQCPDIHIYPGLARDTTALNWQRKKSIYTHSKLFIATPSQWLLDKVKQSILAPAIIETRVIPNGVDKAIFKPAPRAQVRQTLGLPLEPTIFLFAANGIRQNPFKDYETLREAIQTLARYTTQAVLLLALGEEGADEVFGSVRIRYVGRIADPQQVAAYFQAANWYVHASKADTFPNSILEAMACATPVIASSVGGIPEQVQNEKTGLLVAPRDAAALADALQRVITHPEMGVAMGAAAFERVQSLYTLEKQAQAYLDWFKAIQKRR